MFGKYEFGANRVTEPSFATSGQHKMNGVFAAYGHGVRPGLGFEGARIVDLAPTILYLLQVPIPRSIDGHVLRDAFLPDMLHALPITFAEPHAHVPEEATGYSGEDEEQIRRHLEHLGGYVA